MKKIIYLKVDENKNAEILKPDNMGAKECINLMLAAAVWYYKQHYNVGSIEKATAKVGLELLNFVGIKPKFFWLTIFAYGRVSGRKADYAEGYKAGYAKAMADAKAGRPA